MKRYQVVDYSDYPLGGEVVGEFNSKNDAEKYAKICRKACTDDESNIKIKEIEL